MLTRSEVESFRNQAFMLACQIGLKPAANALGIKDTRMRQWNKRYWQGKASSIFNGSNGRDNDLAVNPSLSPNVTSPINALAKIMSAEADRTRSAMARTSRRAFEACDTLDDAQLHEMERAIALEKHGRNASLAHAWNQVNTNVAVQLNVPLPSGEEREEMRSIDAKPVIESR